MNPDQPAGPEEEKRLRRELLNVQMLGVPGVLLIGFALYGLFEEGEPFHPFLADRERCIYMLVIGGAITIWESLKVIRISRQLARLKGGQSRTR